MAHRRWLRGTTNRWSVETRFDVHQVPVPDRIALNQGIRAGFTLSVLKTGAAS